MEVCSNDLVHNASVELTSSTFIPVLVASLFVALIGGSPKVRAWIRLGFRMRREEQENRRDKRPENSHLDAYHDAVVRAHPTHRGHLGAVDAGTSEGVQPGAVNRGVIDERTWADLDLDQVYSKLDHTRSRPGQQYLRHLLRTPALSAEPIVALNRDVTKLDRDAGGAAGIRKALELCDDRRASSLVKLFYGELPDRPHFWWIFPLLTISAVVVAAMVSVWPRALLGLLAIALVNILLQLFYRPHVEALIPAIHEVPAFLKTAKALATLRTDLFVAERETLSQGTAQLGLMRRATTWLKFEPNQERSEFLATLYLYTNLLFLLDLNAFVFSIATASRLRPTMQQMFKAIGYIDATQSIAAWRTTLPHWTAPDFTSAHKEIRMSGIVHPLVKNAVANSLTIKNSSALITGSNMSGKTTFIRALGVNAILAQSLGTAVATAWRAPMLHVMSSIGRSDSVLEGKSYYLAEVESIRSLIEQKGDGAQHLFLIDELFRGTNTSERVAGAYAVLEYLNRGDDIVVVATHDTELLAMLGDAYAPHHFREQISGDTLSFDFTLRDGHATTRNAIALLELMNYPAEIVLRARNALT